MKCSKCKEKDNYPYDKLNKLNKCICHKPLLIYIPPGEHIHINCPIHGDVKIYGNCITWC